MWPTHIPTAVLLRGWWDMQTCWSPRTPPWCLDWQPLPRGALGHLPTPHCVIWGALRHSLPSWKTDSHTGVFPVVSTSWTTSRIKSMTHSAAWAPSPLTSSWCSSQLPQPLVGLVIAQSFFSSDHDLSPSDTLILIFPLYLFFKFHFLDISISFSYTCLTPVSTCFPFQDELHGLPLRWLFQQYMLLWPCFYEVWQNTDTWWIQPSTSLSYFRFNEHV